MENIKKANAEKLFKVCRSQREMKGPGSYVREAGDYSEISYQSADRQTDGERETERDLRRANESLYS